MKISAKFLRRQLQLLKPFVNGSSLESTRKTQDAIGKLMASTRKKQVSFQKDSDGFSAGITVIPKDQRHSGIILYLHGGGYTCGHVEYAKGFGSILASLCGMQVFCAAYRLAPEHPFPAALEDAVNAYDRLLQKGYKASQIILCGESAGGGLIYSLCLQLKAMRKPLPAGLIAISPWVDLTASGDSYETKREKDPSLTKERLDFFADCYVPSAEKRAQPLVSPLFGDLSFLPPSLIFVGEDEILLDDARRLDAALTHAGCASTLTVTPGMWHAYVLYDLEENRNDLDRIDRFVNDILQDTRKLRWMRLDNAAKIYPAARRRSHNNRFRLSATLNQPVDPAILQSALDVTVRRFPSIAVRLRRGVFWYYLEELRDAPFVMPDKGCPLVSVPFKEIRSCAFRVLYYRERIAVEFSHALTDGTGGLIFLKTLIAEYLTQREGITIPPEKGVLDRLEPPTQEELEDSFLKYAGQKSSSRKEKTAFHLKGIREPDGFIHVTTGMVPVEPLLAAARSHGVSVTVFLTAVMIRSLAAIQDRLLPKWRQKPLKVLIPINLRNLFGSKTLRNFALYSSPGIDPKFGDYTLEEILPIVQHQLALDNTKKQMAAKMAANVNSEKSPILKVMPLFIKNMAMKAVFNLVGERKSCLTLSNLGNAALPEAMIPFVKRLDFVLGAQARAPYNCGLISFDGTLYINFIRNTQEPILERQFFTDLIDLGIPVTVESNQR